MNRATSTAAVVGLCLPVLLACSHADPVSDPTVSPPTSVVSPPPDTTPPPTTPTTTPSGPSTPVIPPSARPRTTAGAKAFVRYYIDSINNSWHTRSGAIPRHFSTAGCISCRGIASSIDNIRDDGGFYRGGDWIVTSATPVPLQQPTKPIIHTAIDVTAGQWKKSRTDHLRKIEADKMYIDVHLIWGDTSWLVTSMVPA